MDQVGLGDSGLRVSRIVLGCMSFGEPERGPHPWTLPPDEARPYLVAALEAGITTFDTANVYSAGSSEEIVGTVLGEVARREEVVIATKVHGRMGPGPNGGGLSRGAILTQVDASLRRLGTDYIDLYQIHRWDRHTPIEETLDALDAAVRAGKVRYIGASSMFAYQLATALRASERNGWARFVSESGVPGILGISAADLADRVGLARDRHDRRTSHRDHGIIGKGLRRRHRGRRIESEQDA